MNLRELDDRLVPIAAQALQDAVDRLSGWRGPRRSGPARRPTGPAPLILRLRRLDDRMARRGPLGLLREIPQLGALLLALVVLVAGATVLQRATRPDGDPAGDPGGSEEPVAVGPAIGEAVESYVQAVRRRLAETAAGAPDDPAYAVVSLRVYRSPADAATVAAGYDVVQVFYRPRSVPGAPIRSAEVTDLARLPGEFATVATGLRDEAAELRRVAATITNDPEQREAHLADAERLLLEAAALTGDCRCVFGIVVSAKLRRLIDLAGRTGVRLVDAAPSGVALARLLFRPLLPEERVTVTEGNEAPPD